MTTYIIIALVSYLLGSIPFGYLLVRLFLQQDIRETGSGNIGATNVARSGAKGLAIATLFLDVVKGAAAVVLGRMIYAQLQDYPRFKLLGAGTDEYYAFIGPLVLAGAVAALFSIVGHLFPVWLRFKGGKGVATGAGAFLVLAPKAVLVVLALFVIVLAIFRYVSLGSIAAAAAFPIAVYFLTDYGRYPLVILIVAISSLLIILKHHANIRRLLAGTEPKLGAKPTIPPPQEMEKQA
ncbi:MAG: glycerol-3-phosphate 1-O-acyltransferase PlsY [Acidobacteriota bacterium]|nr:glycerol-3-phosphate 1-O-acyltransferase PlsY [Acidobacteriota bacterium]